LLFLAESLAHHFVHRRFDKPGRDRLAVAIPLPVIRDQVSVVHDVRVQFRVMFQKWRWTWLTDKTQTLYFSGCFLVLKGKPTLSLLRLFFGGDRGFGVACTAQIHTGDQCIASAQGITDPLPANL